MPELPDPSLAWEDLSAVDRRSLTEMLVDKIIIERHPSKIDMDGRRHYLIRAIPYQDLSKRLSGSRRFSDTLTGSGRRPRSRAGSLVGIPGHQGTSTGGLRTEHNPAPCPESRSSPRCATDDHRTNTRADASHFFQRLD
jgi:hypothetical protein